MKNALFYSLLAAIVLFSLLNLKYDLLGKVVFANRKHAVAQTGLSFDSDTLFFGSIREGAQGKYKFSYTNTGKGDLTITGAKASCECTVADWPKDPIHSGESGEIRIEYNSYGKNGDILVPILLTVDPGAKQYNLFLKGTVVP
jgi:Protein of unknown function (DUF1573)